MFAGNRFLCYFTVDFSSLQRVAVDFIVCEQRTRKKENNILILFFPENDKPFDYLTAFSIHFEYIFWRVLWSLKERTR